MSAWNWTPGPPTLAGITYAKPVGGGGRDFSAEKTGSYGASLRIGYVVDNGSLLYGQVGAVQTRFNTTYN